MNQESIAKENCENIAKPELKCNGKCHLAKQLVEISNPTPIESPAKSPNFERAQELVWICSDFSNFTVPSIHYSELVSDLESNNYQYEYFPRIDSPPES